MEHVLEREGGSDTVSMPRKEEETLRCSQRQPQDKTDKQTLLQVHLKILSSGIFIPQL